MPRAYTEQQLQADYGGKLSKSDLAAAKKHASAYSGLQDYLNQQLTKGLSHDAMKVMLEEQE